MIERVAVKVNEDVRYGLCRYCGGQQVLRRTVTYYGEWPVPACATCGAAIQRHTNWLRDARARHLQKRRVVTNSEPTPTDP